MREKQDMDNNEEAAIKITGRKSGFLRGFLTGIGSAVIVLLIGVMVIHSILGNGMSVKEEFTAI